MVAKKVATKSKATVATGKRTTQRAAAAKKAVGKAAPTAAAGSSRGLSVAVFGGARPGNSQGRVSRDFPRLHVYMFCFSDASSDYTAAASELGRQLALRNITLLYGGATVGCMGAVGRAVQENKPPGVARGFIPKKLADVGLNPAFAIEHLLCCNSLLIPGIRFPVERLTRCRAHRQHDPQQGHALWPL